jgi:hypothetical protein
MMGEAFLRGDKYHTGKLCQETIILELIERRYPGILILMCPNASVTPSWVRFYLQQPQFFEGT